METWDIYDINRQKTKETMTRGNKIENGNYHLVVSVCVFNSKNEILIQQRQKDKIGWPGKWDITAAGSSTKGENSLQAARRELHEEVGIEGNFKNKRPILSVNFSRGFQDYYCITQEVDIDSLTLQAEEVQAVKWASRETIMKMIDSEEFIPYYKSLINTFFDMKDATGSHNRFKKIK